MAPWEYLACQSTGLEFAQGKLVKQGGYSCQTQRIGSPKSSFSRTLLGLGLNNGVGFL